jgi:hypothetical protein
MRNFYHKLRQQIQRILRDIHNLRPDRDMERLDANSEYADSQRNEAVNPETLAEIFN